MNRKIVDGQCGPAGIFDLNTANIRAGPTDAGNIYGIVLNLILAGKVWNNKGLNNNRKKITRQEKGDDKISGKKDGQPLQYNKQTPSPMPDDRYVRPVLPLSLFQPCLRLLAGNPFF